MQLPRNRKYNLGKLGAVLIALAGVAAIMWPERADQIRDLGVALAGLLAAIAAVIGWEDVKQAEARKDGDL